MTSGRGHMGNKIIIVSLLLVVAAVLSQAVTAYFVPPTAVMHLGGKRFEVRIADTDRTRQKGLSGSEDLPEDQAMVFVFDRSSRWGIWMKDMNYAIDIAWLDESKKVVDYVVNATPDSYPSRSFYPREDARYVVEVTSGTLERLNVRVGDEVIFSGTSRPL